MNKRYQVFVSSTYADLKEERAKVMQTIMELDCLPAGMEIFPAIDEEQFNFIKSIIDDCDYYLLIIGGRYGSLTVDGLSFTEREYDYAIEKGIKVIAFIHGSPQDIPIGKSESDPAIREKLESFKEKVASNRLVKFWKHAEDLPGLVSLSLSKTIKTYPAIGWIRASQTTSIEILEELNEQRKENQNLKIKLHELEKGVGKKIIIENLADFDDSFEIKGFHTNSGRNWQVTSTWREIFGVLAPHLLEFPNDNRVEFYMSEAFFRKSGSIGIQPKIDPEIFKTIKIQLEILGLVQLNYLKADNGSMALFWSFTSKGKNTMYQIRAVKKPEQ